MIAVERQMDSAAAGDNALVPQPLYEAHRENSFAGAGRSADSQTEACFDRCAAQALVDGCAQQLDDVAQFIGIEPGDFQVHAIDSKIHQDRPYGGVIKVYRGAYQ